MRHETCLAWLKINAWALIVVGVYFSWALYPPLNAVSVGFVDLAVWPLDGGQNFDQVEARLFAAIIGGLTVGLGAFILAVARLVYAHDPALGAKLIYAFALPWMVVDSVGSVIAGAWFNVILNLIVFVSILAPLVLRRAAPAMA